MTMIAARSAAAASEAASARRRTRDRWVILGGVGCITAGAWIYVVVQARQMSGGMMSSSMVGPVQSTDQARMWTAVEFGLMLLMWAVMMVAMMLPSALPMTLVYAAIVRKAARGQHPVAPTGAFVTGYLAMWGLFAVAATAVQMGLEHWSVLTPALAAASPRLAGGLLIGAGLYELTPLSTRVLRSAVHLRTSSPNTGTPAPSAACGRDWHSEPTASAAAGFSWDCCSWAAS